MSDLLVKAEDAREPLQASFSDASNPIGLDGIEFIEFATPKPQALGQVLEMAGFKPVARHRSREVLEQLCLPGAGAKVCIKVANGAAGG